MKIIDCHAHIYPEKIAKKATDATSDFYDGTPMYSIGRSDKLLESGKKIGVTKYLVYSTATTAGQVESVNNFILSEAEKHEEFLPVGTMHIDYEDYEKEIERIYKAGMKGIKFHPDLQKFNLDDERLSGLYHALEERDMFLVTHSGDYRYGYSHPTRCANVANKFKKLKIIAAHCGGWSQAEIARECLKLPNVYFDSSSTAGFFGAEIIKKAVECFGTDKIFFGSDFPMWGHEYEFNNILKLGFNDSVTEKILYSNFADFFGL